MKLLLFSDVHCDQEAVEHLVLAATTADVVIGAGDFATCRQGLQPVIDALSRIDRHDHDYQCGSNRQVVGGVIRVRNAPSWRPRFAGLRRGIACPSA